MKRPLSQRSLRSSKIAEDAPDALDREPLDQLRGREDRRVVVGAPAEQGEVVAHARPAGSRRRAAPGPRRRRGAWRASCRRGRAAAAGARSAAARRRARSSTSSCFGRVREVVVAADHVGDPHLGVVDGDGEVVERRAVAAGDHEVVGEPVLETAPARGSGRRPRSRPRRGPAAGSRPPPPASARRGSRRCRAPACRRARRRRSRCRDRRGPASTSSAIRSRWRSARSAWLSGPSSQSSSSQRSASRICSTFSGVERSRSVSSIRSTRVPPEPRAYEPVVERGARPADVQGTGRRRGEADSRGLVHQRAGSARDVSTAPPTVRRPYGITIVKLPRDVGGPTPG